MHGWFIIGLLSSLSLFSPRSHVSLCTICAISLSIYPSYCIIMPLYIDPLQHGPFYLLKGLIQVLDDHKWEAADTYQAVRVMCIQHVCALFCVCVCVCVACRIGHEASSSFFFMRVSVHLLVYSSLICYSCLTIASFNAWVHAVRRGSSITWKEVRERRSRLKKKSACVCV